MQRIHLKQSSLTDSRATIESDMHHHLFTVCRLKTGSTLEIIIDESRLLLCSIMHVHNDGFEFKVIDQFSLSPTRDIPVHIFQSLPKQDKLTDVCKLCTEVGVSNIYPVISEYCNVTTLSDQKIKRILRSIESAAKQSKQLAIPKLHSLLPLSDQLNQLNISNESLKLVAFEGNAQPLSQLIQDLSFTDIHLAIGPEGGYSHTDLDTFKTHGFHTFSLGSSILRTEHAGFAAINYLDGFLSNCP